MRLFSIILLSSLFIVTSCKNDVKEKEFDQKVSEIGSTVDSIPVKAKEPILEGPFAISWEGTLGGKIPVFFHYTIKDSILSGEVTYMNTKAKKPIRILGEIRPNGFYRILEFDKEALITGIWSLTIKGESCTGKWYAPQDSGWYDPKNRKEFAVKASPSDSLVREWDLSPIAGDLYGMYEYNYTKENGNIGHFSLEKLTDNRAVFEILGLGAAPGFNHALIEETDIDFEDITTTEFDFLLPDSDGCDFKVQFYKDFATVKYTNGYCRNGYFGHNATVEGLFLKVK